MAITEEISIAPKMKRPKSLLILGPMLFAIDIIEYMELINVYRFAKVVQTNLSAQYLEYLICITKKCEEQKNILYIYAVFKQPQNK